MWSRLRRPRRVWTEKIIDSASEVSTSTAVSPDAHSQYLGPAAPDGAQGTCYAFATATAIRSAQQRIFSRTVEDHGTLVSSITSRYGCNGIASERFPHVLRHMLRTRRLGCREVTIDQAKLLANSRVVLASFALCRDGWDRFSSFFAQHPEGVLASGDLRGSQGGRGGRRDGHAVVIVGQHGDFWMIKNSWGGDFADGGFFRVSLTATLFTFYDVHFCLEDLTAKEIHAYHHAPHAISIDITRRLQRASILSLGLRMNFTSMQIEGAQNWKCPIADWNVRNPDRRVLPGYQIVSVNGETQRQCIIDRLAQDTVLKIHLVVAEPGRFRDVLDEQVRARSYAHAIADGIRDAQSRIFGRVVDYHDDIASYLLRQYESNIVDVYPALRDACASYGFHCAKVRPDQVEHILCKRHLIASLSLDSCAWKRLSIFFDNNPDGIADRDSLRGEMHGISQAASLVLVGQSDAHWDFKDLPSWDLGERRAIRIAKDLATLEFYDIHFFVSDLSPTEARLYSEAPPWRRIRIRRSKEEVKGVLVLGWTINTSSLQVEWVARWGPIGDFNSKFAPERNVHPGHRVVRANGLADPGEITRALEEADIINIVLAKSPDMLSDVPPVKPWERRHPAEFRRGTGTFIADNSL